MKIRSAWVLVLVASSLFAGASAADNMLMGRVPLRAEIALEYVKSSVEEHGYRVAHVQLCDGGMHDFGYESDVYRVVFFGKVEEVRAISQRYPELVSFLPLKIAVIAEQDETLLSVVDPEALVPFFRDQEIQIQLGRWHSDLVSILDDVRRAIGHRVVSRN